MQNKDTLDEVKTMNQHGAKLWVPNVGDRVRCDMGDGPNFDRLAGVVTGYAPRSLMAPDDVEKICVIKLDEPNVFYGETVTLSCIHLDKL